MIIIPARLYSTRFPKKVLYEINGIPMVIKTAMQAANVDRVVIATDSDEVNHIAKRYGFDAVLTSKNHKSGTDRINEAAAILGLNDDEIIINVQADEPFIEPHVIENVYTLTKNHLNQSDVMMCSVYKNTPISSENNPNNVKVVIDNAGYALYFSRSLIPYPREKYDFIKIHLGIYGYSKKMLERFCSLKVAPLEEIEKLEQLRALYYGYKIAMQEVESSSIGIDTLQDLQRALYNF